jgi:RNA polymerase sigma-70 factor (ECF subfamily)
MAIDWTLVDDLFRRYNRSVFRRAQSILRDPAAAEDATQEVFLRAMRSRADLDALGSVPMWLNRITTNLCLNRVRDGARRKRILKGTAPPSEPAAAPHAETALAVRALMRSVPEPMQVIAVHYFVDEMSQDEICALLGLPRRAVRTCLQKVRDAALAA